MSTSLRPYSTFSSNSKAHFHDAVYDVTEKDLDQEALGLIYEKLPEGIRRLAEEWGLSDTEVRGQVCTWLDKNPEAIVS